MHSLGHLSSRQRTPYLGISSKVLIDGRQHYIGWGCGMKSNQTLPGGRYTVLVKSHHDA